MIKPNSPDPIHGSTILIVDDDEAMRQFCAHLLQRAGSTPLLAETGTAAIQRCREHREPIQLLVLDVMLPPETLRLSPQRQDDSHLHGPALMSRLLVLHPESRVLFMSAFQARELLKQGLDSAGWPILHKPFTSQAFIETVRQTLIAPKPVQRPPRRGSGAKPGAGSDWIE